MIKLTLDTRAGTVKIEQEELDADRSIIPNHFNRAVCFNVRERRGDELGSSCKEKNEHVWE